MDEETIKTHLNTLKEIILDEERLSTYVSVSKELCIHVNESKSLLNKAVDEIRSKHPNTVLNINYVISGLAEDNKASTHVCPESDIDEYRKRFKVVFFEHIYSVNQGKSLVDKVALMAISRFEDYPLCSGLIKSNLCVKRTSDEIGSLKSKSQVSIPDQKSVKPPLKKNKEEQPHVTVVNGNGDSKKVTEMKIESKVKEEKISPKKEPANGKLKEESKNAKPPKGIAGFFSRSDSASKKSTKEIKVEKSDTNIKSKADGNNKKVEEKKIDVDDEDDDHVVIKTKKSEIKSKADGNNKKVEEEKMDVDDDDDHVVVIKTEKSKLNVQDNKITTNGDTKKKENNASSKNKSKDSNKSLTQIKKNAKVDKKRKRVLCVSDSESDEEKNDPFENDEDVHNQQIDIESEDEIPPTPAVNTIKVSSGMINPRKRRKIVTKTYTDEDGYILTRKEEVYESVSESEDIADTKENINIVPEKKKEVSPKEKAASVKIEVSPKNKKNGAKSTKKKISPPQKGKQSTLMSFFKKT